MSRPTIDPLRFGTRGSALARWQTAHVMNLLRDQEPQLCVSLEIIESHGDRILDLPLPLIGGKGVFTAELEIALREGRIDCAVHSLKDLPVEKSEGLVLAAIPARASAADALVSRGGYRLETLPTGARVGTSSHRRGAQLLAARPDLTLVDIRGNVDTRVRKALDPEGPYDAIVLAVAGLARLGQEHVVSETLDLEVMLPAPGQGAIAVQARDDISVVRRVSQIADPTTTMAVAAERAFLAGLGGGCSAPVAAYAQWDRGVLNVHGRVCRLDGSDCIDVRFNGPARDGAEAREAGMALAGEALQRGARRLLDAGT
jgi:hydroxymethylbilane synthase